MFKFLVLCVDLVLASYAIPERIFPYGPIPKVVTPYYAPHETVVTPYASNERVVIPYVPNEKVVIPYAPHETVVAPYAPNGRVVIPFAPNERVVIPYAPTYNSYETAVTPYASNERVMIPNVPNQRVAISYAPHETGVTPYSVPSYAPHGAMYQYGIVPRVIDIAPPRTLRVTYSHGMEVNYGNVFPLKHVTNIPKVSWDADEHSLYTLIMTDPLYLVNLQNYEFLHWIVGNIPGNQLNNGEVITTYRDAQPPPGTGLHKYVFLLFKQKGRIQYKRIAKRQPFSTRQFAEYFHLGQPIAGNFFQAQHDGNVY